MFKKYNPNCWFILIFILLNGCAQINTQAEYDSPTPREADLTVPPGMTAPELNSGYKMMSNTQLQSGYKLDKIKDMRIDSGGSERWLVMKNKSVDETWPMLLAYINQLGLAVKYQNKNLGSIQTDWASKNNTIDEGASGGVRQAFSWIGWGSMYSLNSKYMFKINAWQNESNTLIFVTNYQMNEVYPNCVSPHNSSRENSAGVTTKWMPVAANPQLELEFLTRFMAFAGFTSEEVKQVVATAESSPAMAHLKGTELTINDQFDRAWWRVGLALERIGLGITDKDRTAGIYYVYPLQSQIDNPNPGFFDRLFKKDKSTVELPKAKYQIKLISQGNDTVLTISLSDASNNPDVMKQQQKYLNDLLKELK